MLEARFYAGFRNLSGVIGRKLHYPKSVCIVLILYKESIKRAVFNTQYTVRPQSVYRVPYRTGQKNDLIQDAFIRNYDILCSYTGALKMAALPVMRQRRNR